MTRKQPLSRERIVHAAFELRDAEGDPGLTFRAPADELATGAGAIYWHVANKDELIAAAIDAVVGPVTGSIRDIALGLFDAIDVHPWIGAQLAGPPGEATMLRIFERFG